MSNLKMQHRAAPQFKYISLALLTSLTLLMTYSGAIQAQKQVTYKRTHHGNMDMKLTNGDARGYAFIKQIFKDGRKPEVTVQVRPDSLSELPEDWSWEVFGPSDNQLKGLLTFDWYGQASCPDDLTNLEIDGPGGPEVQNPLSNPIAGYFDYQSFSVNTLKNICLNWAADNNCNPIEPGCLLQETFDLEGGTNPTPNDQILLKASCISGVVANDYVAPVMVLNCNRDLSLQ